MLSEHFVASIDSHTKAPNTTHVKDAGIFLYELQPLPAQRGLLKKSATPQNCLAVTESHIFAAQADKAVVHVYNRVKGNQEAIVPFPERITALALAADDTILVLGTASGQVLLWEFCTGRVVSSAQSHLQSVTGVAVDDTSTWLLSGSADSNIHVWSIPAILSFGTSEKMDGSNSRSPDRTLSSHRGAITALVCGHSRYSTLAASAAADSSIIIWDYVRGDSLRTYLLEAIPRALAMDSLNRAVSTTYDDGSVQLIEFFTLDNHDGTNPWINGVQSPKAIQPGSQKRWKLPSSEAEASTSPIGLCLAFSSDGSQILSGHQDGKVALWDLTSGKCQPNFAMFPGPVSNIFVLPITGLQGSRQRSFGIQNVVKPRIGGSDGAQTIAVPGNYTFSCVFTKELLEPHSKATSAARVQSATLKNTDISSDFTKALRHPSFPRDLLEDSLAELASWTQPAINSGAATQVEVSSEEYMALDPSEPGRRLSTDEKNQVLQDQIQELRHIQRASSKYIEKLLEERRWMEKDLVKMQRAQDAESRKRKDDSLQITQNAKNASKLESSAGRNNHPT